MVDVTEPAQDILKKYLAQNNFDLDAPMRVMKQNGCGGTRLVLAFDDPNPGDGTFEIGGMTFLAEKALLQECGQIKVDFVEPSGNGGGCGCSGGAGGLVISSTNPLAQEEAKSGGCGCSSGSCG